MDPIRLPSELTSPLFALLHTKQIAKCTAVLKEWRNTLLTDPIANRVLDLTDTKKTLTGLETIQLVNRLASLSSHPLKEIHLDISKFTNSLVHRAASQPGSSIGDLMRGTNYSFPSLISTISSATKGKLGKLSLEIHSYGSARVTSAPLILAIIETTLMILDNSEDLREIQFSIPAISAFSLVSKGLAGDQMKPRIALIEGSSSDGSNHQSSFSECNQVIQAINKFTGGQLESLVLPHERVRETANRSDQLTAVRSLFGRIRESRNTLTSLSLGVLVTHGDFTLTPQPGLFLETWNFVKDCPSLERLKLSVYSPSVSRRRDDQREEIVDLIIPQIKSRMLSNSKNSIF